MGQGPRFISSSNSFQVFYQRTGVDVCKEVTCIHGGPQKQFFSLLKTEIIYANFIILSRQRGRALSNAKRQIRSALNQCCSKLSIPQKKSNNFWFVRGNHFVFFSWETATCIYAGYPVRDKKNFFFSVLHFFCATR